VKNLPAGLKPTPEAENLFRRFQCGQK